MLRLLVGLCLSMAVLGDWAQVWLVCLLCFVTSQVAMSWFPGQLFTCRTSFVGSHDALGDGGPREASG
jgi:hypothetical protein